METQFFEINIEDLICRLPALFPYIGWNPDGTVTSHVATDSPNGSYGKIVDNMHMPTTVKLTNYVSVQEKDVPSSYRWDGGNTITLSESVEKYFAISGASFLRNVLWYYYDKIDSEPSEAEPVNSIPAQITDESPDFLKIPIKYQNGTPIVCEHDEQYDYFEKKAVYSYYQRKDIIKPCTTYSYRTIIEAYYKYKDIVGKDNTFIKFVEYGIGKVIVDRNLLNLSDIDKYPDVPDFIYLSQVRTMLNEYLNYQKASKYYQSHYSDNPSPKQLAEKHKQYVRMGGDNMTNWLMQILQKSYDVANEYKCHAENQDFPVRLNASIMLSKKEQAVGLDSTDVNEFVAGNRYYDGDLLTYDGRTYICVLDKLKDGSENNYPYVVKTNTVNGVTYKNLFKLIGYEDGYTLISQDNIEYVPPYLGLPEEFSKQYVVFGGDYYEWDDEKYVMIDAHEYCTGVWDENSDRYVFDAQHFVLLSNLEDYNEWYDESNVYGEKYRFFEDMPSVPSYHVCDYIRHDNNIFEWDYNDETYVPVDEETYTFKYRTNTKLRDLRMFREYVNPFGNSEEPGLDEDWLYHYKVGNITGLFVETDDIGNILNDDDTYSEICYSLHAYGNVIDSITYDAATNAITFVYVVGAHLIAEYNGCDVDIDGNVIRFYDNFQYDETSTDGVRFEETYVCMDGTISDLVSSGDFTAYVSGDLDTMVKYAYEKFRFITVPVNTLDDIEVSEGTGEVSVPSENGFLHANTVREEWMNELYHHPKVKSDVSIDRGNGASFERHIRLGEIRTMEDFEYYQNGGYFKLSES